MPNSVLTDGLGPCAIRTEREWVPSLPLAEVGLLLQSLDDGMAHACSLAAQHMVGHRLRPSFKVALQSCWEQGYSRSPSGDVRHTKAPTMLGASPDSKQAVPSSSAGTGSAGKKRARNGDIAKLS